MGDGLLSGGLDRFLGRGVGSFYHQGACRGSQSARILPTPTPVPGEGSLTCAGPGCLCPSGLLLLPSPTPEPGSGQLSLPLSPDKSMDGGLFSIHLPDADSAPAFFCHHPPAGKGPGTWRRSWALWPRAAVSPILQVRPRGQGPLGPLSTSSCRFCHLLFSEHQSPRHFHSADLCFAQVGVDRPGCWSLLSHLPAHPRPPRWPRSMRQPLQRTCREQASSLSLSFLL